VTTPSTKKFHNFSGGFFGVFNPEIIALISDFQNIMTNCAIHLLLNFKASQKIIGGEFLAKDVK